MVAERSIYLGIRLPFMDRLAIERQKSIEQIIAEEQGIKGMVIELRKMLTEGNNLLVSA